jgi:hypothetical protein
MCVCTILQRFSTKFSFSKTCKRMCSYILLNLNGVHHMLENDQMRRVETCQDPQYYCTFSCPWDSLACGADNTAHLSCGLGISSVRFLTWFCCFEKKIQRFICFKPSIIRKEYKTQLHKYKHLLILDITFDHSLYLKYL